MPPVGQTQSEVESALDDALRRARERCPGARLDRAAFALKVTELGTTAADLHAHGAELALASACLAHDKDAIAWFDREIVARVPRHLASFRWSDDQVQDLMQTLRIKALTGPAPRLARYSGRGPLGAWVRVTAIRMAINTPKTLPMVAIVDREALTSLAFDGGGPEFESIRRSCVSVFNEVIDETLAGLSARDRTLLRLYHVDGLSIDGIGMVYEVNRSTAARWLVTIRQSVLNGIKGRIKRDLGANSTEFHSLVKIIRDDVNLSLQRLLIDGRDLPGPVSGDQTQGT